MPRRLARWSRKTSGVGWYPGMVLWKCLALARTSGPVRDRTSAGMEVF